MMALRCLFVMFCPRSYGGLAPICILYDVMIPRFLPWQMLLVPFQNSLLGMLAGFFEMKTLNPVRCLGLLYW